MAFVSRGRVQAVLLLGLMVLHSCCALMAPLADEEPAADERRGGVPIAAGAEANGLLLEQLERAQTALLSIASYEAVLLKEERVDGRLFEEQRLACKVRHEPFSVYLRFLAPDSMVGQEALFAGERYEGKLIAHSSGLAGLLGAVALDPHGRLAMRGNRYPITDMGMRRLLERVQGFVGDGAVPVFALKGATVDGRPCVAFEAVPSGEADFALARIYFDDEWGLPVAFESFEDEDGMVRLLERYTYTALQLAADLGDEDFDRENPSFDLD